MFPCGDVSGLSRQWEGVITVLESDYHLRNAILSRAHESELIRQNLEANGGDVTKDAIYEVLAMRRAPVRGL